MSSVLIVDDHPFIRSSVNLLLVSERFEVVGQTDNGIDAVRLARELSPDLMILDISIPGLDGLEVIARVKAMKLALKILILTSQQADYFSLRCMKAARSAMYRKPTIYAS